MPELTATAAAEDLHARIAAALDAEEATAKAAAAGPWSYDPQVGAVSAPHARVVSPLFDADGRHFALQDPARTLCRIAAQRRTLQRHAPIPYYGAQGQGWACSHEWGDGDGWHIDWHRCSDVLDLADALDIDIGDGA